MKNSLKLLFSSMVLITLMLSSCRKDTTEMVNVPEKVSTENIVAALETEADIVEWINNFEPTATPKVEHASLEEINALMLENGLSPFSERDVEEAKAFVSRTTWSCSLWTTLGDWNDSGTVTAYDMVLARKYLCSTVGCGGELDTFGHPLNVRFFGFLSFLEDGSESGVLNNNDAMAAAYFILGITACN